MGARFSSAGTAGDERDTEEMPCGSEGLQVEIKFAVAQPMVLRAESSYSKGAVQLEVLGAACSFAPLLLFALWK